MELIEGMDYCVRYIPFPSGKCYGMVLLDDNNFFNIYINSNIGYYEQRKALKHELAHLKLNHFYSDKPISLKEAEAHENN